MSAAIEDEVLAEVSWTERGIIDRRHRIEIRATSARGFVRCEHGFHLAAEVHRATAGDDFPIDPLPEAFRDVLPDWVERMRNPPPPTERVPFIDPWGGETFDERLERIAAEVKASGKTEEDQFVKWEDLTPEELADIERIIEQSMRAEAERKRILALPHCIVCGKPRDPSGASVAGKGARPMKRGYDAERAGSAGIEPSVGCARAEDVDPWKRLESRT